MPTKLASRATWSSVMHKSLGDGSAFVGVDNGGHHVYGAGSACADKATVGFLASGHLPDKDVYCTDVAQK
ncbi:MULTISPECIES: alpha/beta hydrolase [Streptomyces]|uniref:alpha/beta hydrolase n=1 Tax=Streptomyces TaxID=1883 RepID=UPI001F0F219A|nr:alpha/beta hydrolase [Streptomyces tendae]